MAHMQAVESNNLRDYLMRLPIGNGIQENDTPDISSALYNATRQRNWENVIAIIQSNQDSVAFRLTESNETVLHIMAESLEDIDVVEEILTHVAPASLELLDLYGNTALSRAAMVGNSKTVDLMLEMNPNVMYIENHDRHDPLDHAARFGHKGAVYYLLTKTLRDRNDIYRGEKGARLLMYLISSNLFGAAVELLRGYPEILHNTSTFRKLAFEILGRKPLAFKSIPVVDQTRNLLSDLNPISNSVTKSFLYRIFPWIKRILDIKLMHMQARVLSEIMCNGVDWNDADAHDILKALTVVPVRLGKYEPVMAIKKAYPPSMMTLSDEGLNIFQLAVIFRNEKVFNLLHEHVFVKQWVESFKDHDNKNILHLAGELSPSRQVPGAASQMQRDLQWFKAVEKLVHPSLREEEYNGKTPRQYFTEQHKELVKEGEDWMKKTASSCSVVATLMVAVVFTAMLVPGRINDAVLPNLLKDSNFFSFIVGDALALFSSTSSVIIFLNILTSRYTEDDFLVCLPMKLIIGLIMLFFSVATMTLSAGIAVDMVLAHRTKWIATLMSQLVFLSGGLFELLQFPLLTSMIHDTFFRKLLKPKK